MPAGDQVVGAGKGSPTPLVGAGLIPARGASEIAASLALLAMTESTRPVCRRGLVEERLHLGRELAMTGRRQGSGTFFSA